jgi:hypothetical protein
MFAVLVCVSWGGAGSDRCEVEALGEVGDQGLQRHSAGACWAMRRTTQDETQQKGNFISFVFIVLWPLGRVKQNAAGNSPGPKDEPANLPNLLLSRNHIPLSTSSSLVTTSSRSPIFHHHFEICRRNRSPIPLYQPHQPPTRHRNHVCTI